MTRPLIAIATLCVLLAGCGPSSGDPARDRASTDPQTEVEATPAPIPDPSAKVAPEPFGSTAEQPRLAVDPKGLRWFLPPNGSARPLPFGTAQADVLASLEGVRGEAGEGTNQDCGAGPVQYANWADGLSLVFQGGKFAGWGLDGRSRGAITTADGIGVGTTRAELDDAIGPPLEVRQTSLGTEFSAGEYHGVLDGTGGDARISDMWAGVSCVAR